MMKRHLVFATILAALLAVEASGQKYITKEEELAYDALEFGFKISTLLCIIFGAATLVLMVIVVVLGCCLCRLCGKDSGRTSGRKWAILDIVQSGLP